jgi:hypothetical protein
LRGAVGRVGIVILCEWDAPEGDPGQSCVHLFAPILSSYLTSFLIFSVCCYSIVSISVVRHGEGGGGVCGKATTKKRIDFFCFIPDHPSKCRETEKIKKFSLKSAFFYKLHVRTSNSLDLGIPQKTYPSLTPKYQLNIYKTKL